MRCKTLKAGTLSLLAWFAPAAQAAIINGDFENGLNDWVSNINPGTVSPAGRLEIRNQNGSNYVWLSSGEQASAPTFLQLYQGITVQAGATELVADIKALPSEDDPTSSGSIDTDFLSFTIQRSAFDVWGMALVDDRGVLLIDDPLIGVGVALRAPSDPFFDFQVVADLSMFVGETVLVSLFVDPGDDGFINSYAMDNIAINSTQNPGQDAPAAASLPGSGLLLMSLLIPLFKRVTRKPS